MKKRIFSLLLALCMVLSLLPATVLAAEATEGVNATIGGQTVEAATGDIWYNTTTSGTVGEWTQTEPASWNIKLDNTKDVAELTFKSANVTASGSKVMDISGEGALKIIVDGDSHLKTNYYVADISMAGGTTITSVGDSLLTIESTSTSAYYALTVKAGSLTLDHAYTKFITKSFKWAVHGIDATGLDVAIIGGETTFACNNNASLPLKAGSLTISDYAKVTATGVNDHAEKIAEAGRTAFNVAGDFVINSASLSIADNYAAGFETAWEYIFSKMPTVTGATAQYKASADGEWQPLTDEAGTANIAYPYIEITAICTEHQYDDLYTDTDCNICGATREVPTKVTLEIYATASTSDYDRLYWEAQPGEVYYAITSGGRITQNLGALTEAPASWNIKLDNTKAPAELVFNSADIQVNHTSGQIDSKYVNALTVTGAGALKVITQADSQITVKYANAFISNMTGGITFTSVNNSKLTISSLTTGYWENLQVKAGDLAFENANMYFYSKAVRGDVADVPFAIAAENAAVTIKGGEMAFDCLNQGIMAIEASSLAISSGAKISIYGAGGYGSGYPGANRTVGAVKVAGDFTVNKASLKLVNEFTGNYSKAWAYAFSKMPTLTSAEAVYSETADGANPATLAPADPAAAVVYPYVEITAVCDEHEGGTATCTELAVCTICGNTYGDLLDHTEAIRDEIITDATCDAAGSKNVVTYCSVCETVLSTEEGVEIPAGAHTAGDVVVENEVAATCAAAGSYDNVVYCTVCEAEISRVTVPVDKLAHTEEILAAVAPTCTATGLTEGKKCSVCGDTLVAQETVDALGHTYDQKIKDPAYLKSEATLNDYAVYYYACTCGASSEGDTDATWEDTAAGMLTGAYAAIGDVKYESLAAAVAAANDGDIVTLLKVSISDGALVINKSITVDFNGITYTAATAESGAAVVIGAGANVTLTNSAKLQTRYANRDQFQYLILNNGTLTTSNITLRGSNMTAEGAHAAVMNNGTLTLDDATTMTGTYGLVTANSNVTKAESAAVEAPEGYIWQGNALVTHTEHTYDIDTVVRPTATACGYTVHACVCGESYKDTYTFAFAKINETEQYYTSLAAAIEAAEDGQTVTLLKVSASDGALVINKSITVDFNGITYTAGSAESGAAVVIGEGANVTLTNGDKLQTRYANRDQFQYLILNNGTLTTSNITLRGGNMTAEGTHAAVMNNGTLIQGEGTSITGAYGVVEGNA